jgi:serine/threonine protein phosphatase 1
MVLVLGNHEEMLLNALESRTERDYWFKFGGQQTLDSYGVAAPSDIPREHLAFVRTARDFYQTDTHIFVHANYWPNRPMHDQPITALRWEFVDPKTAGRHFSGKPVIAGHTPQESGRVLDLGFLKVIDTDASRGGWLTALDVTSGAIFQANQQGEIRHDESRS